MGYMNSPPLPTGVTWVQSAVFDDIVSTIVTLSGLIGANFGTDVRTLAWEVGREGVIHPSNLRLMVTHFGAENERNILCAAQKKI